MTKPAAALTVTKPAAAAARADRLPTLGGAGLVAVFAAAVLLLAASTLRSNEPVLRTPFSQRWNLFAPDPPSANLNSFLFVRLLEGSAVVVAGPFDLSTAVREDSRSRRWAPPKLIRAVTRLNVAFERHAYDTARELVRRDVEIDQIPTVLQRSVLRHRGPYLHAYRRLLSAAAKTEFSRLGPILSVRGVVVRTPVVPFERRGDTQIPARPVLHDADVKPDLVSPDVLGDVRLDLPPHNILVFDSGWMTPTPDVEPLRVHR